MKKIAKGALLGALMFSAATPALAAAPSNSEVYSAFLDFLQAQMAYTGAEYHTLSADQQTALASSFENLVTAEAALEKILGQAITVA